MLITYYWLETTRKRHNGQIEILLICPRKFPHTKYTITMKKALNWHAFTFICKSWDGGAEVDGQENSYRFYVKLVIYEAEIRAQFSNTVNEYRAHTQHTSYELTYLQMFYTKTVLARLHSRKAEATPGRLGLCRLAYNLITSTCTFLYPQVYYMHGLSHTSKSHIKM